MLFLLALLALFLLLWLFFALAGPLFSLLLHRGAHFAARFRYGDYLPVFVIVAAGIGLATAAGNGFVELAELVTDRSTVLTDFDARVHAWARAERAPLTTALFMGLTFIGDPPVLGSIVAIAAAALALRRRWRWMAYLVITSGIGGLLNLQLKAYFARARPELAEALRHASGYSFPSGHAMGSTVVLGALAYLAYRTIPRHRWRAFAIALLTTLVAGIATSRIYLGVHWISDVAAGVAAGTVWVATVTIAYEVFRRIRLVRSLRKQRS